MKEKSKDRIELNKSFAKFIKKIRNERGFTQAKVAELLEIDPKHLSKIETFHKNVTLDVFLDFCEIFNINPAIAFSTIYNDCVAILDETIQDDELYVSKIKNLNENKRIFLLEMIDKLSKI